MKLHWWVIAALFTGDLYAAVPRNESVTKSLVISAEINIAAKVSPGIAVKFVEPQVRLNWDGAGKSFIDRRFNYYVYLDGSAVEATTRYSIGVRDINLNCATKGANYQYSGIDATRAGGFEKPLVTWSSGAPATINSTQVSGDVKSPAGRMSMIYSSEFGRDVPGDHGSILFRFPLLTRELADGGADCTGGAILMFYGEL